MQWILEAWVILTKALIKNTFRSYALKPRIDKSEDGSLYLDDPAMCCRKITLNFKNEGAHLRRQTNN